MTPVTRLLARHRERFAERAPAWLNPTADLASSFPEIASSAHVFTQDYGTFESLNTVNGHCRFGDFPDWPVQGLDDVVLTLPRGKEFLDMMIACAAGALSPGGRLWLAGEIRDGIKSATRRLQSSFAQVTKIDSARHCALVCATGPAQTATFNPEDWRREWSLVRPGRSLNIQSWPGVFNHGALDNGTALLLENLPVFAPGSRVLDLGSGAGVIGAVLLAEMPELQVTLADTSGLACLATSRTLACNHLQAEVVASDGFSQIEGQFDWIVTNPPFHAGHRGNPDMTPRLLAPARNFLAPRGQLILVANRHLPYQDSLRGRFSSTRVVTRNSAFQVLACQA